MIMIHLILFSCNQAGTEDDQNAFLSTIELKNQTAIHLFILTFIAPYHAISMSLS